MQRAGIGLIGSGFMGRAHANAFNAVGALFVLPVRPQLTMLADASADLAASAAAALGFARSSGDWRTLVNDPQVDIVSITTPTGMHCEMALAAIAAGKTVYCEKPLGANLAEAQTLCDAAGRAGCTTLVGYNYLQNPLLHLAREMLDDGELGEPISFRGVHAEDYMADPATPFSWRCESGGGGVSADLGSHIVSIARYLMGGIDSLCGHVDTVYHSRPDPQTAAPRPVEIDEQMHAIVRFASGASGSLHASWLAWGRKMQLEFELVGSRGSLVFSQERFNELRYYRAGQPPGRDGFTTLLAGPEHADYRAFCPAPGHQLGFNDLKVIEAKSLLLAMADPRHRVLADFTEASQIARVIEAILRSSQRRNWVEPGGDFA